MKKGLHENRKTIHSFGWPSQSPLRVTMVKQYVLCLYVAGSTPQSIRAIKNLKAICETHLHDRYDFTVVDLYEQCDRAREAQIVVAPTLVREWPSPVRRLIGDLSQTDRVLAMLELPTPVRRL